MATCLRQRSAFSSLVTTYTHAVLFMLRLLFTHFCFSGSPFVDFIYDRMYLSTTSAEFIAGQRNILQLVLYRNTWNYSFAQAIDFLKWNMNCYFKPYIWIYIIGIRQEYLIL